MGREPKDRPQLKESQDRLPPDLLRAAYASGFFPMPEPNTDDIAWFKPDPRAILPLDGFHCSHSLRKRLKRGEYRVTFDRAFEAVMRACADRPETWITEEFVTAYTRLHRDGDAHSVEVWFGETLVGGTYGVALGAAFFAESKFHTRTDASKVALYHLVEHLKEKGYALLEVQFLTPHLATLGAIEIPARDYLRRLARALQKVPEPF